MILANYFDVLEIFNLLEKLNASENISENEKQIISQIKSKILLFKCPSCGIPIGWEVSRKDWEESYLKSWSDSIKVELEKINEKV